MNVLKAHTISLIFEYFHNCREIVQNLKPILDHLEDGTNGIALTLEASFVKPTKVVP